ncbi:hypothetical protein L7F22_011401 [Adiantum nelumboides]|nr:hypothetical protein [Adiantum nelumboides]
MMLMSRSLLSSRAFGGTFKDSTPTRLASQGSALVGFCSLQASYGFEDSILREGPSCVFVGPVEFAQKDRLEALYQQARDSYYSGQPLIVDDMFDKVEVRLRWYGSKLVMKYPRCSLKRLSVYADAEVDNSQVMVLASIWTIFLALGLVAALGPPACALNRVCKEAVHDQFFHHSHALTSDIGSTLNLAVFIAVGLAIGVPVSTAALGALKGLWKGDLVALKGSCPSCGEEVYVFVRVENSPRPRHKTECHVCEHPLVFHAKVERSAVSLFKRPWAYGRVYLASRLKDLAPP